MVRPAILRIRLSSTAFSAGAITIIALLVACSANPASSISTPPSPLNSPLVIAAPTPDEAATHVAIVRGITIKLTALAGEDATTEARRRTPQPTVSPGPSPTLWFPPTSAPRARFREDEHGGTRAGNGYITVLMDVMNSKNILLRNTWYEVSTDGQEQIVVQAGGPYNYTTGASGPDGFLLVYRWRMDPASGKVLTLENRVEYRTPDATGSVEIVGADGEVLELLSAGGKRYFFSVPERRWLP